MAIHVFYDNSNVWGGARNLGVTKDQAVPWAAIRVHFKHIFSFIEQGRKAHTRILAGSVPPSSEELWEFARENRYETDLLRKVESDDGSISEQGVDEVLHLKMANVLLDFPKTDTLVVVTGDGNISEFGTGFIPQIERALRIGWKVEVWSWSNTLSRKYLTIRRRHSTHLRLISLDAAYEGLTFVQPGSYHRMIDGIREEFDVSPRYVGKLPTLEKTSYFP